jgi:hypothetical protein
VLIMDAQVRTNWVKILPRRQTYYKYIKIKEQNHETRNKVTSNASVHHERLNKLERV